MRAVAVIPARYSSTRFPGKALADISGRPMIQWVYEQTSKAKGLDEVVVATDDIRILDTVRGFGGQAVLTSAHHQSGTERVAEAAAELAADIIVNVQGDEPLIRPEMIDRAVEPLRRDDETCMVSLKFPIGSRVELENPNIVKVVCDHADYALYFSRSPIPYDRRSNNTEGEIKGAYWKHIGLYVYRRDFLQHWDHLKPSKLEQLEGLEQLRVLENGYRILVLSSPYDSFGVDTPADIQKIYKLLQTRETN